MSSATPAHGTGAAYNFAGTAADSTTLLNSLFDVTATVEGRVSGKRGLDYEPGNRRSQFGEHRCRQTCLRPWQPLTRTAQRGFSGRPVFFDVNAPRFRPQPRRVCTPILFGDFKQGYIIGVRGGAGINVKILDQPQATAGLLGHLGVSPLGWPCPPLRGNPSNHCFSQLTGLCGEGSYPSQRAVCGPREGVSALHFCHTRN